MYLCTEERRVTERQGEKERGKMNELHLESFVYFGPGFLGVGDQHIGAVATGCNVLCGIKKIRQVRQNRTSLLNLHQCLVEAGSDAKGCSQHVVAGKS